MAKDCLEGIRDPLWLDMVPLHSLGMGIQSLHNVAPTSKNRVAVVALVLEVFISIDDQLLQKSADSFQDYYIIL